ncbi:MAG TPA: sigma-70 family RNA polymerase sigma factor [Myxococcota bacterium]|nr:sigma-70 family RNA polymerase sigma factor [Myxococcota bacterium]
MSGTDWLDVLERVQRGDRPALAQLTALVTGYLARFRAYEQRDSWSDVSQEVLIKLIRASRAGQIEKPEGFVAFVGTTTRRCLIDWLRKNSRVQSAQSLEDEEGLADDRLLASSGLTTQDHPDLLSDLKVGLEHLPEIQRRVLVALYLEGHSYQEASELLGVPLGTLKRHQTQGLKALRVARGDEIVAERNLPSPTPGGITRISLAELGIRLEAGAPYEWNLAVRPDPSDPTGIDSGA